MINPFISVYTSTCYINFWFDIVLMTLFCAVLTKYSLSLAFLFLASILVISLICWLKYLCNCFFLFFKRVFMVVFLFTLKKVRIHPQTFDDPFFWQNWHDLHALGTHWTDSQQGILCWGFKGVQEEIPSEEASTL